MKTAFLILLCLIGISSTAFAKQDARPVGTFPRIPWEPAGISKDGLFGTRIEKLGTPTGWIIKIITLKNSIDVNNLAANKPSVTYMFIPDPKHEWGKSWPDYQELLDAAGRHSLIDKPS